MRETTPTNSIDSETDRDTEVTPAPARKSARRWRRRLVILLVVLALLFLFRRPILQAMAGFLVVDEPFQTANVLYIDGGPNCYEEAARLHSEYPRSQVLMIFFAPSRVERLGILPLKADSARVQLTKLGIPDASIVMLQLNGHSDWDKARHLHGWLKHHSADRVVVLCSQFSGRRKRYILNSVLGEDAEHIAIRPVRYPLYDDASWWHSRFGVLAVFNAYLRLGYVWLRGEDEPSRVQWNPDQYEQMLRQNRPK